MKNKVCTLQTQWVQDVQSGQGKCICEFNCKEQTGGGAESVDKQTSCVLEIALSGDNAL